MVAVAQPAPPTSAAHLIVIIHVLSLSGKGFHISNFAVQLQELAAALLQHNCIHLEEVYHSTMNKKKSWQVDKFDGLDFLIALLSWLLHCWRHHPLAW